MVAVVSLNSGYWVPDMVKSHPAHVTLRNQTELKKNGFSSAIIIKVTVVKLYGLFLYSSIVAHTVIACLRCFRFMIKGFHTEIRF